MQKGEYYSWEILSCEPLFMMWENFLELARRFGQFQLGYGVYTLGDLSSLSPLSPLSHLSYISSLSLLSLFTLSLSFLRVGIN